MQSRQGVDVLLSLPRLLYLSTIPTLSDRLSLKTAPPASVNFFDSNDLVGFQNSHAVLLTWREVVMPPLKKGGIPSLKKKEHYKPAITPRQITEVHVFGVFRLRFRISTGLMPTARRSIREKEVSSVYPQRRAISLTESSVPRRRASAFPKRTSRI